jgi:transcriptional regulator with XRE-family HTH domain
MTLEEFMNSSLGELASKTGIDRHRWSRYLSGKVSINYSTLCKAAKKLNMSTEELLKGIERRIQKSA